MRVAEIQEGQKPFFQHDSSLTGGAGVDPGHAWRFPSRPGREKVEFRSNLEDPLARQFSDFLPFSSCSCPKPFVVNARKGQSCLPGNVCSRFCLCRTTEGHIHTRASPRSSFGRTFTRPGLEWSLSERLGQLPLPESRYASLLSPSQDWLIMGTCCPLPSFARSTVDRRDLDWDQREARIAVVQRPCIGLQGERERGRAMEVLSHPGHDCPKGAFFQKAAGLPWFSP